MKTQRERVRAMARYYATVRLLGHTTERLIKFPVGNHETRETSTARTAARRISDMLNLRNVVKSLPSLHSALEGSFSR